MKEEKSDTHRLQIEEIIDPLGLKSGIEVAKKFLAQRKGRQLSNKTLKEADETASFAQSLGLDGGAFRKTLAAQSRYREEQLDDFNGDSEHVSTGEHASISDHASTDEHVFCMEEANTNKDQASLIDSHDLVTDQDSRDNLCVSLDSQNEEVFSVNQDSYLDDELKNVAVDNVSKKSSQINSVCLNAPIVNELIHDHVSTMVQGICGHVITAVKDTCGHLFAGDLSGHVFNSDRVSIVGGVSSLVSDVDGQGFEHVSSVERASKCEQKFPSKESIPSVLVSKRFSLCGTDFILLKYLIDNDPVIASQTQLSVMTGIKLGTLRHSLWRLQSKSFVETSQIMRGKLRLSVFILNSQKCAEFIHAIQAGHFDHASTNGRVSRSESLASTLDREAENGALVGADLGREAQRIYGFNDEDMQIFLPDLHLAGFVAVHAKGVIEKRHRMGFDLSDPVAKMIHMGMRRADAALRIGQGTLKGIIDEPVDDIPKYIFRCLLKDASFPKPAGWEPEEVIAMQVEAGHHKG